MCVLKTRYLPIKISIRMLKTPAYNPRKEYNMTTIDTEEIKTFSVNMDTWWDPNGPVKALHSFNKLRYLPIKISIRMLKTPAYNPRKEYNMTTIDTEEIKTFSVNMDTWWDPNGPVKALHSFNKLRVPFIIDAMKTLQDKDSKSLDNLKLLDVGCGGGVLSEALAKHGVKVTGIDASRELIDVAIQHSRDQKFRPSYFCSTIEEHAMENTNQYDGIVASEVIEHVNNQDLFIKSCVQALKPNGRIFFTTPSKTRLSQLFVIWFAENIMNCPEKGTHQYDKFISVEDLSWQLEINGCKIERTQGLFLNMITNKWFWTKNQLFFYALQAVKH